jgi:hypothetical protein
MKETEFKSCVRTFFDRFGGVTIDIPPTSDKTPDFEIQWPNESYILELKIKEDDTEEIKTDSAILKRGEILSKSKALSKRNRLSGIIKDGCDQLAAFDPTHVKLHLLWLHCIGLDADLHWEQFRATLFGAQKLISSDLTTMAECFYFHSSDFFRYRENLDGAFISYGDDVTLCVNSLSSLVGALRSSRLYSSLTEGILDPGALETERTVLIADAACPRDSEQNTLEYLRAKYKLTHLQAITFGRHTAAIAIPD